MDKRYLSLIAGFFVLILMSASAFGWADSTRDYSRLIDVNVSANVTGYPVYFNITNLTNINPDGSDLLFFDETETINFSFWIENNETDHIDVWVNFTGDTYNGSQISMLSGNNTPITAESNISAVYPFVDTAEIGVHTDIWTFIQAGGGTAGYNANHPKQDIKNLDVNVTGGAGSGAWTYRDLSGITGGSVINATYVYSWYDNNVANENNMMELNGQIRTPETSTGTIIRIGVHDGVDSNYYTYYDVSVASWINTTIPITTGFHKVEVRVFNGNYSAYIDGVLGGSFLYTATEPKYIYFGGCGGGIVSSKGYYDNIRVRNLDFKTEPTYFFNSENQIPKSPIITLTLPTNTTYYTTTINLTVQANDTDSFSFSCNVTDDGSLIATLTNDSTYSTNLTKTGGNHNITVNCIDSDSDTSEETVYYYVWMGLNISTYYSDSGNETINWSIYITNGTSNYSDSNLSNPTYIEWDSLPQGDTNITTWEENATLYYKNQTQNATIDNSSFYTQNFTLTAKIDNPMTIISSSGQSLIEGQTTTISCTVAEGTPTMSINDVYVSNPYILTVSQGLYNIECDIGETSEYRPTTETETLTVNALIACTTNSTFAFEKNISTSTNLTTIDMSSAVAQDLIKSDLSDVYADNVSDTWKNISTGNYYIIVNNTGLSTINLKFGNYFVNNSWDDHQVEGTPINISEYTQINPYQIFNLLDELTGEYLYPPNSTLMSIVHCNSGDSYINIADNDTKFLLATSEYIDKAAIRITYTADAYYSRQLYPSVSDALVLHLYLADAFVNAIDRIDFIMQDQTYYNSKFQVYKTLGSEAIIITEGYFDASRQFSTYLMEDLDYFLRTNDNGTISDFGRITIVAPETKYIGNVQMVTNPETVLLAENIHSNTWTDDNYTTLYLYYDDDLNQTINITITVYFENGTVFQQYFSEGISSVSIDYNISNYSNQSFYVTYEAWHETFGNSPIEWLHNVFNPIAVDLQINSFWYPIFALFILMVVGMTATREAFIGGSLFFMISLILLVSIDWLSMSLATIGFIGFLIVLGIINYFNQGGE